MKNEINASSVIEKYFDLAQTWGKEETRVPDDDFNLKSNTMKMLLSRRKLAGFMLEIQAKECSVGSRSCLLFFKFWESIFQEGGPRQRVLQYMLFQRTCRVQTVRKKKKRMAIETVRGFTAKYIFEYFIK